MFMVFYTAITLGDYWKKNEEKKKEEITASKVEVAAPQETETDNLENQYARVGLDAPDTKGDSSSEDEE